MILSCYKVAVRPGLSPQLGLGHCNRTVHWDGKPSWLSYIPHELLECIDRFRTELFGSPNLLLASEWLIAADPRSCAGACHFLDATAWHDALVLVHTIISGWSLASHQGAGSSK
jgi:hypothetical protein